jgi:energy-coupling factor transporter ATP-binding protein EcfA2
MKVSRVDICDFRGFPGPQKYDFDLGSAQNLLVYGENGSGKSSLFRAIAEFFSLDVKPKEFGDFKNVFTDPALAVGTVTLYFDDAGTVTPVGWNVGGTRQSKDARVAGTAIQVSCIDYRALLRTNFLHPGDAVNLFELAVKQLLPRYPVTVKGRSTTVGDLWRRVLATKPKTHHKRNLQSAIAAVADFNTAFEPILTALSTKTEELLAGFPGCAFQLKLRFPKVDYDQTMRQYTGKELNLEIVQNGKPIPAHHHFLNEARLSAIALAIYLAGLLISVPAPVQGAPQYPRLLVLDDVLIGLDMSNRIPVLDILDKYFKDWQVFLFTHDKVWAEIVQLQTRGSKSWSYCELYLGEAIAGVETPVLRPSEKGWDYFLARARMHLASSDERAAAVYARAAFETKLKSYCDKHHLPVKYNKDARRISADDFWQPSKADSTNKAKAVGDAAKEAALAAMFNQIELYRKIVLNPLSHSAATPITKVEIQGAIDAVSHLQFE